MIRKDIFFNGFKQFYTANTGKKSLPQKVVAGIEFLLDSFNSNPKWKDVRHIAYAFATMCVETGWTFQPIKEFRGKVLSKQQAKYWNTGFYGRGYVQITWEANYRKAGQKLGVDFVGNPDLVMDPYHAFNIMTYGMHEGWFTGKKLSDYINGKTKDYKNSRRIINGLDHAAMIGGYAEALEIILRTAYSDEPIAASAPEPEVQTPAVVEEPKAAVETETTTPSVATVEVVDVEEVPPTATSGWGTWVANIRAQVASLGIGGLSLGSLQFLQNPTFIQIAIGVLVAAGLVSAIVYIVSIVLKNKEKREREQRAHELTLKQMEIAADPKKVNVRVVKK